MIEKAAVVRAPDRTHQVSGATIEQPVTGIARALAVVPSLGPASKAWRRLGFIVSQPFEFVGCLAFDVNLANGGIRFLAPRHSGRPTALGSLVSDRLIMGAGLLGWSWRCADVRRSCELIQTRSGRSVHIGDGTVVVPPDLNPGATTILESGIDEHDRAHCNRVTHLDHLVLSVSDTDAAVRAYEAHFGLHATTKTLGDRRYAFLEAKRGCAIEVGGPSEPQRGPLSGNAWGLAFRSGDLDATVAGLDEKGIGIPKPHATLQGGRIVSLPMQLGGIKLAFLGK